MGVPVSHCGRGSQTDHSPPDLGQRDIITTNQVNTESQAIAIVKGMINVSSCWHLNAQYPYSHTPNSYLTKIPAIAISQNHKEPVMGL